MRNRITPRAGIRDTIAILSFINTIAKFHVKKETILKLLIYIQNKLFPEIFCLFKTLPQGS